MKVALFKDLNFGFEPSPFKLYSADVADGLNQMAGYICISEWVDVDFPLLAPETIVPAQLKQLDDAEAELRAKFAEKLHELAEQRAKLKALTHEVTP